MRARTLSLLVALVAMSAQAAEGTRLTASTASAVVLDGSSNLAAWRCRGTSVDALMVIAAPPDDLDAVEDFRLRIPVSAFYCGNPIMESDLRRALKAQQHPMIEFSFVRGIGDRIAGDLTLAGVTRRIELTVSAERLSPTRFRICAELPLRMTDFAIKPPTALFGAIRARDRLTVSFDLILEIAS